MKRYLQLTLALGLVLGFAFFLLKRPPEISSTSLKFTGPENPTNHFVEFTDGALKPGEFPFVAFADMSAEMRATLGPAASSNVPAAPFSLRDPLVFVDGHEAPSQAPLGLARVGENAMPVYYSSTKFYRLSDGARDVREIAASAEQMPTAEERGTAAEDLRKNGYMPAILLPSGERVVPTGELNVIPDPTVSVEAFKETVKTLGMSVTRAATSSDEWWLLKTTASWPEEIFKAANALVKAVPCRYAEPNWFREVKKRALPADPLYKLQWHLKNTGQTAGTIGADISAEGAWGFTSGNSQVIVAIFDDGFDIGHSDLPPAGALVHSRDFVRNTSDPRPADNDPEDPDNHGTPVWGLVAALHNNNRGVAGVAPGVKFMLLRTPMELDERGTADGIRWAADHGAHVMSNSWGYTDPGSVVTSALSYARKSGRGGKGTLVLFASGNENANIGTTNDLSNNINVLAIGATTHQDKRTTYSNYGDRLFAVAPAGYGDKAGLVATDRAASKGYTSTSYTDEPGNQFDGTSGACPIAAGVAALVFSVNPDLRANEVEAILKETADKVQPATAAYNASGRSQKYGFGRLNAKAAVTRARGGGSGGGGSTPPASGTIIKGTVKNKNTGEAISTAVVTLSTGQEARGDVFSFAELQPGKYTVAAIAEDFKRSTRTITIEAGQTKTVNFSLTPIPLPSIVATVRKTNADGQVVFAQGVTVSCSGNTNKTARTGWGETAGKAKFYDLPAGTYSITWSGYSASVKVVLGQTAYIDLGVSP